NNVAFLGMGSGGQAGVYLAYPPTPVYPPSPIKVADLNTMIPGGIGTFTAFPPSPVISGGNVAFLGMGSGGQIGVYAAFPPSPLYPPSPVKIVDTNTSVPGGPTGALFTSFMNVSISGASMAFTGLFPSGKSFQNGVYIAFPPSPIFP